MRAVLKRCAVNAMAITSLLLVGCSNQPQANNTPEAAKKPAAATEPVTGQTAFTRLYTAAHKWAPDVEVMRLTAKEAPGVQNAEGKAAIWEAMFASPDLHAYRVDSYSIVSKPPNIYKGLTAGLRLPWSGTSRDAQPIDPSTFSVDSDAAYKAATADPDAQTWFKKNSDKKLSFVELGNIPRFHAPVWYLVWGDNKGGYSVYVDATSGKVIKK
jgi:hypothetical protein